MLSNLKNYFITQTIVATCYYGVKYLTPFKPMELELTAIDRFFMPHPAAVWIYMSFFFLFMAGVTFSTKEDSIKCCKIILLNSLFASMFFIFMPTTVPFTDYARYLTEGSLTYDFMMTIRANDDTYNCFPSLHIANSLIATVFLIKNKTFWIRIFSLTWMTLVIWSVMSTKQHIFYDVAGGAVVAFLSYHIYYFLEGRKRNTKELTEAM